MAVAYQNLAKGDPQVQFALTLFPEAQKLLDAREDGAAVDGARAPLKPQGEIPGPTSKPELASRFSGAPEKGPAAAGADLGFC